MERFFKELFEYSHHFNQQLINLLVENKDKASERSMQLINHMINAHQVWNSRILGEPSFGVWEMHPIDELMQLEESNHTKTMAIIDSMDLSTIIDYKNTAGNPFSNSVRDMLFHVVNHSTYHRGQIASDCKRRGIATISTDYIFYKWQGF
jgi:uncharacterized damage-inducible protein DinB